MSCLNIISKEEPGENVEVLDYTRQWITTVNCGGLYVISDIVYRAFYAIELSIRNLLEQITHGSTSQKDAFLQHILEDGSVQFYWALILNS